MNQVRATAIQWQAQIFFLRILYYITNIAQISCVFRQRTVLDMDLSSKAETDAWQQMSTAFVEIATDAVWVKDMRTGEISWFAGPTQRAKYNFIPGSMLDDSSERIHKDDQQRVMTHVKKCLANKSISIFENEFRYKGSEIYYTIRERVKVERDVAGQPLKCYGAWTDITAWCASESNNNPSIHRNAVNQEEEVDDVTQLHEKLRDHEIQLSRVQFMLDKSQEITKIGCWNVELKTEKFSCSNEFYAIHGIDKDFDFNHSHFFFRYYTEARSACTLFMRWND
jgi:PAS domain-containing protein